MSRQAAVSIAKFSVGAFGIAMSLWLYQSVSDYGWQCTLRYIWEGEYYPEHVRSALEVLDATQSQFEVYSAVLELIETSLARAKLNSVDDRVRNEDWTLAHLPENLEKDIVMLSFNLDKLAASVDAVILDDAELRPRKKQISSNIVLAMERADALLNIYKREESINQ
jgi:hypothetical protein